MQIGFSSYTFRQYMRDGRMSLLDVMGWISETDATHMWASKTACWRPPPASPTRSDCSRRFEP